MFRRRQSPEAATLTDMYMLLRDIRAELQAQRSAVGPAMESMASAFALMVERLEAERQERRALVEAVQALTRALASRDVPRPRVIGGSVFAARTESDEDDVVVIDQAPAEAEPRFALGDKVRCRFGDSWIEGLEVCDLVSTNGRLRYRLRRTVDHYELPATFTADEVAVGVLSEVESVPQGRWSRT